MAQLIAKDGQGGVQGTWAGPCIQALAGLNGHWDWIQRCIEWRMGERTKSAAGTGGEVGHRTLEA